jgi:gamma-glutamyltranspeptidase
MYLDENGEVNRDLAINGPLAGGIPGEVAGLEHLAEHYGAFTGEDARNYMPKSISAAKETRKLLEESYRRTRDAEESTRELTDLIMERAPDYFLPKEVMAMVIGQMMKYIAKTQTET